MPEPNRTRLRVGVLPFLATGPLGNDGLALSLSQEIGAGLARFRWFDVISPMALMHRPPLALISEESLRPNELDYVIDGAISRNGEKYQINVRLLDLTQYASPVWSERFELGLNELYRLDEMVAADRRAHRSAHSVHRGTAEAARQGRRDQSDHAGDAHGLQLGAREVRKGRASSSIRRFASSPATPWRSPGRRTGACRMWARPGPRMRPRA